jgi:transcription initiation factor IIF auxiliary subunit
MLFKITKRVITKTVFVTEIEASSKEDAERIAKNAEHMKILFVAEAGDNSESIAVKKVKQKVEKQD